MLLSRSVRQRAASRMLKASTTATQSRGLFFVPIMHEAQKWSEEGIGRLMSPEQFKISWTDNQSRLVSELNRLTEGTQYNDMSTLSVLTQTARDPELAQLFNYASMAHNNHFYFKTLSSTPTRPSQRFGEDLEEHFSSAASLRATFLSSAEAMFAPGFVWLVQNASPIGSGQDRQKYGILNTYAAGSPYAAAAFRRQAQNMSNVDNGIASGQGILSGVGWDRGRKARTVPGGVDTIPLMCVSTWEHMYLRDFGVTGKREYLEAWWDSIDWAKVEQHVQTNERSGLYGL